MTKTNNQQDISIVTTIFVVSLLSLISSTAVLITFCAYKQMKVLQIRIISMLNAFDLLWSIVNIIVPIQYWIFEDTKYNIKEHPYVCSLQSWITVFSAMGGVWWSSVICHQILITFQERKQNTYNYYFKRYTQLGFLLPVIFATMQEIINMKSPLFLGAYGQVSPLHRVNCFIRTDVSTSTFYVTSYCCFFLPIWVSFGFNLYTVIKSFLYIRSTGMGRENYKQMYYLFIYPLIIFMAWIIPTIEVLYVPDAKHMPIWMDDVTFTLNLGIGFFNSIAYSGQAIKQITYGNNGHRETMSSDILLHYDCEDEYQYSIYSTPLSQQQLTEASPPKGFYFN